MPDPGSGESRPEKGGSARGAGGRARTSAPRWVLYGRGMALVFEFTGIVGAGVLVGHTLDGQLGCEPWLTILFTLIAVVGGFIRLVQVVQRLERGRD